MRKILKKGAAALALALSIACAIPGTVSATGYPTINLTLSHKKENVTYDGDLISYDDQVVYQSTDKKARDAEYIKCLKQKGTFYTTELNRNGVITYYVIKRTYQNDVTGAKGDSEIEVSPDSKLSEEVTLGKTIYLAQGEPAKLKVKLINGDVKIDKVKSSKNKILSAKIDKRNSLVETSTEHAHISGNIVNGYYYYKSTGEKVNIPKASDGEFDRNSAEYKNSNASSAEVYLLLTPKKAGKANLSFNIYNTKGQVTGKVSCNVVVRSDDHIFKTLSFGGKSLLQKTYGNSNYINYGRKVGSYDYNVSKKSKGKLVVKANKGYKVVKIQVGSYERIARRGYHGDVFNNSGYEENVEGNRTDQYLNGVYRICDLNGDGDALDKRDGQLESDICYHYKTVKSGSTIKLSKVGLNADYCDGRRYFNSVDGGDASTVAITKKNSEYAPTMIRITYYSEESKSYGVFTIPIYTKAKKFKM